MEPLPTHGGSLRIYGCRADDRRATTAAVDALLAEEASRGMQQLAIYREFQSRADRLKDELLIFLIDQKRAGKSIAAYGAAAKGTTLLNYAGVKPDLLPSSATPRRPSRESFCQRAYSDSPAAALRERQPEVGSFFPEHRGGGRRTA